MPTHKSGHAVYKKKKAVNRRQVKVKVKVVAKPLKEIKQPKGTPLQEPVSGVELMPDGSVLRSYPQRPSLAEQFTSPGGSFKIHYSRTGTDAVFEPQNNGPDNIVAEGDPSGTILQVTNPAMGAPSYVQRIAFWLDTALWRYKQAGFPDPTSRWPLMQVYVWNLKDSSGTPRTCSVWGDGSMDFDSTLSAGSAQDAACHNLFHMVQHFVLWKTGAKVGSGATLGWWEAMAHLAPDFVNGWQNVWMQDWAVMMHPSRVPLPNAPGSACVLWRYVCDRFSNMSRANYKWLYGADVFNELLNLAKPGVVITWDMLFSWMQKHREARPSVQPPFQLNTDANSPNTQLSKEMQKLRDMLTKWSQSCPDGADVYSDWLVANIVQDFSNANSKRWFGYADHAEPPGLPRTRALYGNHTNVPIGLGMSPWTANYYALDMGMEAGPLRLRVTADPMPGTADLSPNLQVVLTDGTRVVDVMRSKGDIDVVIETAYTSPLLRPLPIRDVFLIFGSEAAGVKYSISLEPY